MREEYERQVEEQKSRYQQATSIVQQERQQEQARLLKKIESLDYARKIADERAARIAKLRQANIAAGMPIILRL